MPQRTLFSTYLALPYPIARLVCAVALFAISSNPMAAQTYALQIINNDPYNTYDWIPTEGFQFQTATGNNDLGHVVGYDYNPSFGYGGFVRIGESFTQILAPAGCAGSGCTTFVNGINNADTVVGSYDPSNTGTGPFVGFSWKSGNLTPITFPSAYATQVTSISNNGIMVGFYRTTHDGPRQGFILDAGAFVPFNCQGAAETFLAGVNNAGHIVGTYDLTQFGQALGFFFDGSACHTITGAPSGINDAGQISGTSTDAQGNRHGFRMDPGGQVTTLDFTDDQSSTWAGINNSAQVVGSYVDSSTQVSYGFVYSTTALIDPIPDLLNSAVVTTDGDLLASLGRGVVGVGADGVTQVVVRVFATAPGQQFTLSIRNDHAPSTISASANEDGALGLPGGQVFSQSQITATSQNTNAGPAAFAIYRAPLDFARASGTYPTKSFNCPIYTFPPFQNDDGELACRLVNIQVQGPTGTLLVPVQILRPPVLAVHGLWSNSSSFANFFTTGVDPSGQPIDDSRFSVEFVNYDKPVGNFVASTFPAYSSEVTSKIRANSLGFDYNAAIVKQKLDDRLSRFKNGLNPISGPVAAVQADVVAHSMGGVITRTLALSANDYLHKDNYAAGYLHKVITIATPHLGSPLAIQLTDDQNSCIRGLLASGKDPKVSLSLAVLEGDPSLPNDINQPVSGAIGDLAGDGLGGSLSLSLENIMTPAQPQIPVAFVSGIVNPANLDSLDSSPTAIVIRSACLTNVGTNQNPILVGDPLVLNLTSTFWPNVFNGFPSDAVVPLTSQLDQLNGTPTTIVPSTSMFSGVLHSPGIEDLGFSPPSLLDCCDVPLQVINLLNTPVTDSVFNLTNP